MIVSSDTSLFTFDCKADIGSIPYCMSFRELNHSAIFIIKQFLFSVTEII